MARHKNTDWNLPEGNPEHQWNSIHAALLMDIRDELKALNATLGCYRVARMADAAIELNKRALQAGYRLRAPPKKTGVK